MVRINIVSTWLSLSCKRQVPIITRPEYIRNGAVFTRIFTQYSFLNSRRFAAELSVYFHWLFVHIIIDISLFLFLYAWAAYSASFLSLLWLTIGCTCLCCTLARLLIVMQQTAATAEWRKCVALGDCNRILRVTRTKTRGPPSSSALESESEAEAGNARALD